MDHTARLTLPFIMPSQAQKHITHNEAIEALDVLVQPAVESRVLATPPLTPLAGEAWIVPVGATGAWAGHGGEIAAFQSGAWHYFDPAPGWQVFDRSDKTQLVFDAGAWTPLASLGSALPRLGINTSADSTNRLAVAGAATLLTHAGNGHQLKLNKNAAGDTASLLYQTNWSGRAEMGLAGDDHWRLKVSPDGSAWVNALVINATTGAATVAASFRPATDNAVTLGGSGARWSAVWAATGTIQTSDARQKTDIAPSDLGLDFILALNPVRYRWVVGGRETGAAGPAHALWPIGAGGGGRARWPGLCRACAGRRCRQGKRAGPALRRLHRAADQGRAGACGARRRARATGPLGRPAGDLGPSPWSRKSSDHCPLCSEDQSGKMAVT